MILDAHTHICPPEIRADREAFFSGEDDFRLLYENPKARLIGATDLVAHLDEVGADGACAFGFPWHDEGLTRLCNDYVLAAGRRHPGRLHAFACVNPLSPTAVAEAARCLGAGARGIGEIATYGAGLSAEVQRGLAPLAGLCAEAGVPLLLHTNEPVGHAYPGKSRMEIGQLYQVLRAGPNTDWILAHWGAGLFAYCLLRREVAQVLARVHYDTAAGPFLYKPEVYRRFIDIAGVERLVFGSDYPLLGLPRYLQDMEVAGLTAAEIAAITGGNLSRLLKIEGEGC